MVDIRIRKNERCVIGLPSCDYVFSSTRSCFIAYGFSTSGLERDILKSVLQERGIEAVEAGGQLEPGKFAFCTKICSKIITAQFCAVLANNDKNGPNANVNIEYGLMLGHNKYVIPFQREDEVLPFNVAGLDTIKYNQNNFRELAVRAVDQAINETTQNQPASANVQMLQLFALIKNTTFGDIQHNQEHRNLFDVGDTFGFKLLVRFDGLSYIFLGDFGVLQANPIIWRLSKLLELLNARLAAIPTRMRITGQTGDFKDVLDHFCQIWRSGSLFPAQQSVRELTHGRMLITYHSNWIYLPCKKLAILSLNFL